jgi:hypothetical protein
LQKGDCSYNGWYNPLKSFLEVEELQTVNNH